MALFALKQEYGPEGKPITPPTFKDCVAADIDLTFFEQDEHAEWRTVDGKKVLVILEDVALKERQAHWEAGAKQNFDTGLYTSTSTLFIRVADYGPKPKIGKPLVMDKGTDVQRTYSIINCEEEAGVYKITMERTRQ